MNKKTKKLPKWLRESIAQYNYSLKALGIKPNSKRAKAMRIAHRIPSDSKIN